MPTLKSPSTQPEDTAPETGTEHIVSASEVNQLWGARTFRDLLIENLDSRKDRITPAELLTTIEHALQDLDTEEPGVSCSLEVHPEEEDDETPAITINVAYEQPLPVNFTLLTSKSIALGSDSISVKFEGNGPGRDPAAGEPQRVQNRAIFQARNLDGTPETIDRETLEQEGRTGSFPWRHYTIELTQEMNGDATLFMGVDEHTGLDTKPSRSSYVYVQLAPAEEFLLVSEIDTPERRDGSISHRESDARAELLANWGTDLSYDILERETMQFLLQYFFDQNIFPHPDMVFMTERHGRPTQRIPVPLEGPENGKVTR